MTELLKVPHLSNEHRVAEVNIGRGRIEPGLDTQRFSGASGAFKLSPEFVFRDAVDGAFSKESQLFGYVHRFTLEVIRCQARLLGDAGEHSRPDLFIMVERENEIRPAWF
jgi:hypothetical protein